MKTTPLKKRACPLDVGRSYNIEQIEVTFSKRFVIDVFEDNLHLNHLIYWDKPVKEFLKSYDVEIRQLEEDEVVTRM